MTKRPEEAQKQPKTAQDSLKTAKNCTKTAQDTKNAKKPMKMDIFGTEAATKRPPERPKNSPEADFRYIFGDFGPAAGGPKTAPGGQKNLEKHMVLGQGACFLNVYFDPKIGYFGVQFGLQGRFPRIL